MTSAIFTHNYGSKKTKTSKTSQYEVKKYSSSGHTNDRSDFIKGKGEFKDVIVNETGEWPKGLDESCKLRRPE